MISVSCSFSAFGSILTTGTAIICLGIGGLASGLHLLDQFAIFVALVDGADLRGSCCLFLVSGLLDITCTGIWLSLLISRSNLSLLRLFLLWRLGSGWLLFRWCNVWLDLGSVLWLLCHAVLTSSWLWCRWGWSGLSKLGKEVIHG